MKPTAIFSIILAIILLGGSFGQFYINSAFAKNLNETDNQFESSDDVKPDQQEKTEKKQKELEQKKADQQEKTEKKQKELEQKKADQQEKTEKKQKELEQKKAELQLHRKILEVKQMERSKEYEEKFAEIKDKNQNNTNQQQSNATENFSSKSVKLEEKLFKKSKEIRENLVLNSTKLDSRTQNILEKVNDGSYFGEKITNSKYLETYELVFDSVHTSTISNNSQTSSLSGKMNFVAYDKGNSSLKLELLECHIVVDQTPFNCGFGKARTVSSGQSGLKDSLVIIAFLEDDVLKEIHTTMKIFLHSDTLIKDVETSQVSILGPQSQISHMWFLNGTATLSKIISSQEEIQIETNITNSTLDKNSNGDH